MEYQEVYCGRFKSMLWRHGEGQELRAKSSLYSLLLTHLDSPPEEDEELETLGFFTKSGKYHYFDPDCCLAGLCSISKRPDHESMTTFVYAQKVYLYPKRCKQHDTLYKRWKRANDLSKWLIRLWMDLKAFRLDGTSLHDWARPRMLTLQNMGFVPMNAEAIKEAKRQLLQQFTYMRRKYNFPVYAWAFEFKDHYDDGTPKMHEGEAVCNPHLHIIYFGDHIPIMDLAEYLKPKGVNPNLREVRTFKQLRYLSKGYMSKQDRTLDIGSYRGSSKKGLDTLKAEVCATALEEYFANL